MLVAAPSSLHSQDFGDVKSDIPAESVGAHEDDLQAVDQVREKRVAPPAAIKSRLGKYAAFAEAIPAAVIGRHQERTKAAAKAGLKSVPDHYIVSFKKGSFPYEIPIVGKRASRWFDAEGRTLHERVTKEVSGVGGELTHVYSIGSGGFAAYLTPDQARRVAAFPWVERIEVDGIDRTLVYDITKWGTDQINQRVTLPLDDNRAWTATGAGVHVYILDTGILGTHSEFTGRIGDGYATPNNSASDDTNGHGTHVAGLAAGSTYGVAKLATLHPVRYKTGDSGTSSDLLEALVWIRDHYQTPAVVNDSNSHAPNSFVETAITSLINDSRITFVVASGNGGADKIGDPVSTFPASMAGVITVGATGYQETVDGDLYVAQGAKYSDYGKVVDIWAPGTLAKSAGIDPLSGWGPNIAVMSGTSQAAPLVAGTAALYLQRHPQATPTEVRNSIVANATRDVLSGIGAESPNRLLYIGDEWLENDKVIVDGSGRLVLTNAASGNHVYDQVLLTGQSVRVHADEGQIVRVSFLDSNDDIIQAEFSGCGNLVVSLAPGFSGPSIPSKYSTQYYSDGTPVMYMKGTPSFRIEAPSENSYFSANAVGPRTSTSGSLFPTGEIYNGIVDATLLDFWNPNVGTEAQNRMLIGAIRNGNVFYQGSSGPIGIRAGLVDVKERAIVREIKASGSAVPYFEFGRLSTFIGVAPDFNDQRRPIVAGGDLIQPNGSRVVVAEASGDNSSINGFTEIWTNGNFNSNISEFDPKRPHLGLDLNSPIPAKALNNAKLTRESLGAIRMWYFCGNANGFTAPAPGQTAP